MRPGLASMGGLRWLCRVGPAPLEAWAAAMGWSESAAYSHARRLEREGWLERYPMRLGEGRLLVASGTGVRMSAVAVRAARAPTAPRWAQLSATGWVAAWASARGREILGPRELLGDDDWRGVLRWSEAGEERELGHRPSLVVGVAGGGWSAVQVELERRSRPRSRAVLELYAGWIANGKTRAVMYVCSDRRLRERVVAEAGAIGLSENARTLRVELLEDVRREAVEVTKEPGRAHG